MSTALCVGVAGLAVWNPTDAGRPQPSILPPNERRRAPDTVAVALEVAQAACLNAGRDPAQLPTVFASTYGDLAITDYMCSTLARAPLTLSPTRFHNSVHNAAAGYWSIATGSRQPYCALGAGRYTFAAGLFAAALQVCADGIDVLLVAYDIDARGTQAQITASRGILGAALVLSAAPQGARTVLDLEVREQARAPLSGEAAEPANAMAACLPLMAALQRPAPGLVSLALGPTSRLDVSLRCC